MVPAAEYAANAVPLNAPDTSCSTVGLKNAVQTKVSLLLQQCLKYCLLKVRILVI